MLENEIADFQASLLEILSSESDPVKILTECQGLSTPDAMTKYIATFDPRMVQVAADLVKQWGKRYRNVEQSVFP
ncbi:MAG: hypothetical protein WCD18_11700 [Thermosynechococcaceae cyanobacterium]